MTPKFSFKTRVTQQGDAWGRGSVTQPIFAVAGANDTGTWSDSPNPSHSVNSEILKLRSSLKKIGIPSRTSWTPSSNVFMTRRWIVVPQAQLSQAKARVSPMFKKLNYAYPAD